MKKLMTLLFAAALVFAFAWPAMAAGKYFGQENFGMRGYWYMEAYATDNVLNFSDDFNDKGTWVVTQSRWYFDTNYDNKYGGTVGLEMDNDWGRDSDSTLATIGPGDARLITYTPNRAGRGDDQVDVEIKHYYIWFFIPGTPAKMTVGLQSFLWEPDLIMTGNNMDWFGARLDVPLIKGVLNLTAAWLKSDEGATNSVLGADLDSEDTDIYLINLTGGLTKWLTGGFYTTWMHVRSNGFYPLDSAFVPYAVVPLFTGGNIIMGGRLTGGANFGAFGPGTGGDYVWHGLHVSINPKPFYSRFHFNYFWGNMDDKYAPDLDPSGWAFVGRAGVNMPPFRVGARGWYFSGNDDDVFDSTDPEWSRWSNPDAYFYPFEIFYGGGYGEGGKYNELYTSKPGGSAGLAGEASWQATKKLRLHTIFGAIWSTDEADKPFLAADNRLTRSLGFSNDDNYLGFEIDASAHYYIYRNLYLHLSAAYFIPGDGLDYMSPLTGKMESADDAYELYYRLQYNF